MTKFAVMLATAGMLLAAPALASASTSTSTSNSAQPLAGVQLAQVSVRIGDRERRMHRDRRCNTKVIYRNGRKTVVRNCR